MDIIKPCEVGNFELCCRKLTLRELERAWEQDNQEWAKEMKTFLLDSEKAVKNADGKLPLDEAEQRHQQYRQLLDNAETECPPPDESKRNGKRGRLKRLKPRNLLERLRNFEKDVLRFIDVEIVPFTNNQGESDLRMTKVQQKISGCFRSMEGVQYKKVHI